METGLPVATLRTPVRVPVVVGLKVTVTPHDALAARVAPQVVDAK
jgi:hypothetical protein